MVRVNFSKMASSLVFIPLFFLSVWNHSQAAVDQQLYSSWIETGDLYECQEKLHHLSNTFTSQLGISVLDQRCGSPVQLRSGKEVKTFRPLSVIYAAPEPLLFTSALIGSNSSSDQPGTYVGAFEDLKHCQAAQPQLRQQFLQVMGVSAFDSYCMKGESLYGRHAGRYILQLVGAPRAKTAEQKFLYLTSIELHSFTNKIPENVIQDFVARIKNNKGTIAQVSDGLVWYYASSPVPVRVWQIAGLEKNGTCQSQKERFINGLLKASLQTQPSFYCLERNKGSRDSQMGLAIWSGRQFIRLATLPIQSYTSFEDCVIDLPRIENNLNNKKDDRFTRHLGVVCLSAMGNLDARYSYEAKAIEQIK